MTHSSARAHNTNSPHRTYKSNRVRYGSSGSCKVSKFQSIQDAGVYEKLGTQAKVDTNTRLYLLASVLSGSYDGGHNGGNYDYDYDDNDDDDVAPARHTVV